MPLRKKGKWWYGDTQSDIRDELIRYGELNEDVPTQFADAKCKCGSGTFQLALDDDAGVAIRTCCQCGKEHPIGDSDEYMEEAKVESASCVLSKRCL